MSSSLGLIGLGTMGSALARNIANREFSITVYNRTTEKTQEFLGVYGNDFLTGSANLSAFVGTIDRPRSIILMVDAGEAVDALIDQLIPFLERGDCIVDGGNSNYRDTIRRSEALDKKGIAFIGCGISGGEDGALRGPSLMPGGSKSAWLRLRPIFEAIAARDFSQQPCVSYIGETGAGHYVKMVHNGIEYGVMQLMAEAYDILRTLYKLKAPEIAEIFSSFQKGKLQSYLFDIAVPVLQEKDEVARGYLIDHILDKAGQKGTGKWTVMDAAERGVAIPTIAEAVFARVVSSDKELRVALARQYRNKPNRPTIAKGRIVKLLEEALFAGMIACYAQGFALIDRAANEENWKIDLSEIARIWEGGCIVRADLLKTIHDAYSNQPNQPYLLAIPTIARPLGKSLPMLRDVVALGSKHGVALPALSSSLNYLSGMTTANGPANFIQGLRDYFGAHTYERTNQTGTFHTKWN